MIHKEFGDEWSDSLTVTSGEPGEPPGSIWLNATDDLLEFTPKTARRIAEALNAAADDVEGKF